MEGKTARGASSPAKPALHIPEPLSITRAAVSSSAIGREVEMKAECRARRLDANLCSQMRNFTDDEILTSPAGPQTT